MKPEDDIDLDDQFAYSRHAHWETFCHAICFIDQDWMKATKQKPVENPVFIQGVTLPDCLQFLEKKGIPLKAVWIISLPRSCFASETN